MSASPNTATPTDENAFGPGQNPSDELNTVLAA